MTISDDEPPKPSKELSILKGEVQDCLTCLNDDEIKSDLYIILSYYNILENLIIDIRYYKKMYIFYHNLFENNNFLKRTVRLRMGLPVNGQRSKTNSKNSRKKFYKKFLSRIIY